MAAVQALSIQHQPLAIPEQQFDQGTAPAAEGEHLAAERTAVELLGHQGRQPGTTRDLFLLEHAGMPLVVFDVPLLFEKGGWDRVDAIAVVSAPAEVQRARVLARPGMTPEKFAHVLNLQVPDAEKRARADYVIDTGTTLEETRAAVRAAIESLRERAI